MVGWAVGLLGCWLTAYIAYLAYSDDKVLLGENQQDLQKYLEAFVRNAAEVGLKINLSKTKCLVVSKNNYDNT